MEYVAIFEVRRLWHNRARNTLVRSRTTATVITEWERESEAYDQFPTSGDWVGEVDGWWFARLLHRFDNKPPVLGAAAQLVRTETSFGARCRVGLLVDEGG